jgi:hypothetical protein
MFALLARFLGHSWCGSAELGESEMLWGNSVCRTAPHRTAPNRVEPRRSAPIRADPRRSYSVYRRNHAKPRQTAPNHAEPRRTTPKARHCDTKRDSPKFLTVRRVCDTSESVAALTISPNSQENKTDMLMFSLMLVCFCKQKMAATLF